MEKVTRVAFLYLEPKPREDKETFAQCISCRMFVPKVDGEEGERCVGHGSKVKVGPWMSCGFYSDWPTPDGQPNPQVVADHAAELAKGIPGSFTPEESGLVNKVQCHRCGFAQENARLCGLYAALNRMLPDICNMDKRIKPNACCNAWTEKGKAIGMDAAAAKTYEELFPGASRIGTE